VLYLFHILYIVSRSQIRITMPSLSTYV